MQIYDHYFRLVIDHHFIVKNHIYGFCTNYVDMISNSTIIVPKLY